MKQPVHQVDNLTLAQATKHAPFVQYAQCIDDENRPHNHVGDWPQKGRFYPVRLVSSRMEGLDLVHVLGFEGQAPFYNAFAPHRFALGMQVWLN